MELKTKKDKIISLKKAYIEVSSNDRIEDGYFFQVKLIGTLPKCRKPEVLTYSPYYGKISITTLFGYRKHHDIEPNHFLQLLKSLPVVPNFWFGEKFEITPELEKNARKYVESICTCNAVTNMGGK